MSGPLSMLRLHPLEHMNLKILALALAIVLWGLVPDTSVPRIVRGVPVLLENLPTELALAEPFNATVDVLVTGTVLRTRDLLPGELSPRLDMFGALTGDNVITLAAGDIPTPLGVSVDRIQPAQVRIVLDDKIVAELPVSPVVEGTPADGFDIYEATVEPASVRVSGPRSAIEGLSSVSTEVIRVAGRSETLTRSVAVVADNPVVSVEGSQTVQLTLTIDEVAITSRIEGVSVTVRNSTHHVVVNPEFVGVVLRGPPSVLQSLSPENILATIDADGLEPQADDYRKDLLIDFVPFSVGSRVEVIAITPQRRIDVHVFDQPAESR